MDILSTIQLTLSNTLDEVCSVYGITRPQAFDKVQSFISRNSEEWKNPKPDINYSDPFCRLAYIYMNVPVHSHLIERAFFSNPELWKSIGDKSKNQEDLNICAIGGGPGAELLGVCSFFSHREFSIRPIIADFVLVDRVTEWDESWHSLKLAIDYQVSKAYGRDRLQWPFLINRSFLPLDLTDPDSFSNFAVRFKGLDIIIASYVVSELKEEIESFCNVISVLSEFSDSGCFLLFIDRNDPDTRDSVKHLVEEGELLRTVKKQKLRGEMDADFDDLGEWFLNIKRLPRQNWLSFMHLAQILK